MIFQCRIFIGIFLFHFAAVFGQNAPAPSQEKSITVQSGFMFDNYNSGGFRLLIEYQQTLMHKKHWHWGVGYDTKQAAFRPATDIYDPPELHAHNFSFNVHYHAAVWKDKLLWDLSAGPSASHTFDDKQNNYLLFGLHLGAHINVKIGKKLYLNTAPLVFIPAASDVYFSQAKAYRTNYRGYGTFIQYSVLPLGLRFIL